MLLAVMLITVSAVVVVVATATAVNAFVGTGRQPLNGDGRVNYGKNFKLQKIAYNAILPGEGRQ